MTNEEMKTIYANAGVGNIQKRRTQWLRLPKICKVDHRNG